MKFGLFLLKHEVPEWREAYLRYKLLCKLLKPFKLVSKKYSSEQNDDAGTASLLGKPAGGINTQLNDKTGTKKSKDPQLCLFLLVTQDEVERLKYFENTFESMIEAEFEKINTFFEFKLFEIFRFWRLVKVNISILASKRKEKDRNVPTYELQIKKACQEFYKELHFLISFINLNHEAFRKILKKHKKLTMGLEVCVQKYYKISTLFRESYIQKNAFLLLKIKQDLENLYLDAFYGKRGDRSPGHQELLNIAEGRLISFWESYLYGYFSGFSMLLFFLIVILALEGGLDLDHDVILREHFPLFRGAILLILFMWLLAWNVYVWTKSNINYRLIFKFNYHYSSFNNIMTRMMCFSAIFQVMFLWYILLYEGLGNFSQLLRFLPMEYTPLIVWISLCVYFFFPSTRIFNGQGRLYMFDLFKRTLLFCVYPVDFTIAFATDQLVSFVGFFKDVEYTVCYYSSCATSFDVRECNSPSRFSHGFVVAFIPLFFRMVQCICCMKQNKTLFGKDFFNFLKYGVSMLVALASYLAGVYGREPQYVTLWIILGCISTAYSYYWDLKHDWGFLEPNCKRRFLRTVLVFSHANWYYAAISINLLLRMSWTFSISPAIIEKIMRPELFLLIIGFLEQFRRCMWNLFRVEKEHIANVGELRAVGEMKLPFEISRSKSDHNEEGAFDEYRRFLNKENNSSFVILKDNTQLNDMATPLMSAENPVHNEQNPSSAQKMIQRVSVLFRKDSSKEDSLLKEEFTKEQVMAIRRIERKYSKQMAKDVIKEKKKALDIEDVLLDLRYFEDKLNREPIMNSVPMMVQNEKLPVNPNIQKLSREKMQIIRELSTEYKKKNVKSIRGQSIANEESIFILKDDEGMDFDYSYKPHIKKVELQEMARQELSKLENVSNSHEYSPWLDDESRRDHSHHNQSSNQSRMIRRDKNQSFEVEKKNE